MNVIPRIDNLQIGSVVTLDLFNGSALSFEEKVIFLGINGAGDAREARFIMLDAGGETAYEWEAYRYNGGWVWGSSADKIRLVSVDQTPADLLSN